MRDDDRRDITFLYDKFKLSELSLSIETFAPFEYAASLPACTETQLRDAFNRISHNRRPVMIEGILFKPKNIGLRQMIVDVFDARLLLIIDHTAIENAQEPPTELLNKIAVEMGHVPVAFIFNKVPNGKLSDIAKEVRQVALDLRFKEVGEIAFDERLTAISVRDLIAITGGQLLTTPTDEALDDLAWCFGQTSYSEQEAFEFYQQQKLNNEHPGRVIFSGGSKLGLHFRLARLGFHLFLTGVENASTIEPALLRLAEENKKCVVTFSKPTHEVMKDIEIAFRRGVPFCYEKKLEYLTEATSKLDKNMMDLVLKRSS